MVNRFEISQDKSKMVATAREIIIEDELPATRDFDELKDREWEFDRLPLSEIDAESEPHEEKNNVALKERRLAAEKTQLLFCEGYPLLVEGEDNILIEGYGRFETIRDEFDDIEEVPVYRSYPQETTEDQQVSQTA